MYFATCNIDETIIYELNTFEKTNNELTTISTLLRKSDGQIMARLFTIKSKKTLLFTRVAVYTPSSPRAL